jgi:hypothetical protein
MSSNCDLVFILDIGGCVVKGLTTPKVNICTLSVALHLIRGLDCIWIFEGQIGCFGKS